MSYIINIYGNNGVENARISTYVKYLRRTQEIQVGEKKELIREYVGGGLSDVDILSELSKVGAVFTAKEGNNINSLYYVPTCYSKKKILNSEEAVEWPSTVEKKHRRNIRTTKGALFKFPPENPNEPHIEVFITDWSPCPAACAIAVHRDHPYARRKINLNLDSYFSGLFVRHPLTGDLLPVWIADWVKPGFGTGAVLVNPAHDSVDMQFAREAGMPMRFCLVPAEFDGSPSTWPKLPVIKQGRAVKTGFYDGLEYPEMIKKYFDVLAGRGLAERFEDVGADRWKIAEVNNENIGLPINICEKCGTIWGKSTIKSDGCKRCGQETTNVKLDDKYGFLSALDCFREKETVIVSTASATLNRLLSLRFLLAEKEMIKEAKVSVILVQGVAKTEGDWSTKAGNLALVVSASPKEPASVRASFIDQVDRFLEKHRKLIDNGLKGYSGRESQKVDANNKTAIIIKRAIIQDQPHLAFRELYRLQKQIDSQADAEKINKMANIGCYATFAYIFTGITDDDISELSAIWHEIKL